MILRMMRTLLAFAAVIGMGTPAGLIFIPWYLVTGNLMPLYRAAVMVVKTALWLAGIRVHVEGMENIPAGRACIFLSNHVSNLDPPVLIPLIPKRTSAFVKKGLMKLPLLGYALKLAKFVPVGRDGNVQGAQESVRQAKAVLDEGIHIIAFVEGTRSRTGKLLPFKKGPFFLAQEAGAPCVPVSMWGTETMMAKGSFWLYPGTAEVRFHKPVLPGECADREEMMAVVRERIAGALPEWMRG